MWIYSSNSFIKVAHPVSFPEYLKFDKNGSIISLDSSSKKNSSNNLIHKQPDQILLNDNNWWKEDSHLNEGMIIFKKKIFVYFMILYMNYIDVGFVLLLYF